MSEDRARPCPSGCAYSAVADMNAGSSQEQLRARIVGLQEELIACQRLAALGSMSAIITHEFNNLLTPIMARAEAASLVGDDVEFMRSSLQRILRQSQRALAVAKRLLALAHEGLGPKEDCVLAEVVREAIDTTTRPFEKDQIDLYVSVPEDLRVCAASELLCQLLLNLLLNARQAMKERGGPLSVSAAGAAGMVRIEVRDSGEGIPADRLEQVINPFLAADPGARPNDWQEVGLGLSVCRMIAHHHGARLRARANEGRGCTFQLDWPAA